MALSKEWYDAEFVDSESESLHRAPSIEYSFYNAVKTGDMEYVIKNCKEDAFIHLEGTGVLSRNSLQNIKYHFVVTTAMITRYCIDGGLEPEQAYRLSDFYILKMDSCSTVRQVADLHHEMAKDFTGKMVLQKKSSILSKPVPVCCAASNDPSANVCDGKAVIAIAATSMADNTLFFIKYPFHL